MQNSTDIIFTHTKSTTDFEATALKVFKFQSENNTVYSDYLKRLKIDVEKVDTINKIPFLPIQFFKSQKVICSGEKHEAIFMSSGTGGDRSRHYVADLKLYEKTFIKSFETFYGPIKDYQIFALLPSYIQQGDSSLVYMADKMIQISGKERSGFYKDDVEKLNKDLIASEKSGIKTLVLGVSYALIDFFEEYPHQLKYAIVMETGGMKGRRKEMIREELHELLKKWSGAEVIHSEYGMTELMSQAYSQGNGIFSCPEQMKIIIRDPNDPFTTLSVGKTGGINIIDLANIYSCAFIETSDLGKIHENGTFEILGRFDSSDIRGCNLLAV